MKIFVASLVTETNTFSSMPNGAASLYSPTTYRRRNASRDEALLETICQKTWRGLAARDGHEIFESIAAYAEPAGRTTHAVYLSLREEILSDLREAGPVDIVLLYMHGAMVSSECDDCEGDTLAHVRAIVGPDVPIGLEFDLHCHLTQAMIDHATVMVGFKEYPHTDLAPRAHELYDLCLKAKRAEIRPVMAMFDCRMIGVWRTPIEPMRSFVDRMQSLETGSVLSVTFCHGFPWGDVADVGARILVVTDNDRVKALELAERLGREIWDLRYETSTPHDTIDQALDSVLTSKRGPVVLADVADNAGGGAPGDSTFILRRIIERGIGNVASGFYWDPMAVAMCAEAGEGARLELRVGGKCGRSSGLPIDLFVTVKRVCQALHQTAVSGEKAQLGRSVWVQTENGVDLVLTSVRCQMFAPDAFGTLGISLQDKSAIIVKSTQHFYAGFAPMAAEIRYVTTPGAIPPSFDTIAYTKRTVPFWPAVDNPFTDKPAKAPRLGKLG